MRRKHNWPIAGTNRASRKRMPKSFGNILTNHAAIRQSKAILARSAGATEAQQCRSLTPIARYGNRYIVRADDMLTAFVELQRGIHQSR
jgi:hypothetical protein